MKTFGRRVFLCLGQEKEVSWKVLAVIRVPYLVRLHVFQALDDCAGRWMVKCGECQTVETVDNEEARL